MIPDRYEPRDRGLRSRVNPAQPRKQRWARRDGRHLHFATCGAGRRRRPERRRHGWPGCPAFPLARVRTRRRGPVRVPAL